MLMRTESLESTATARAERRRWPYVLATLALAFGALGLVLAPFGAAVYLALPGIALGTLFAFLDRCPFRMVFALSVSAFMTGLATGVTGLYVAGSDFFALQEWGFLVVAAALWVLPLLGLILGAISLFGAHFRPGVPDSALRHDDIERFKSARV